MRRSTLRSRTFWMMSAIVVAAPLVWFAYNGVVFGDWLDFARGPYSAARSKRAPRRRAPGPPHPGWHNPWVSLLFFVKCAEMDARRRAMGNLAACYEHAGNRVGDGSSRGGSAFAWTLLLWLPVPFYAYSVAFGSVPIFLPVWWPHSWYNTRYGMEMLPAFALGVAFVTHFIVTGVREFKPRLAAVRDGRHVRC